MMTYGPNVPEVDYERFAKPPLKAMIGQIRFPPILKIADVANLGAFQEAVRDRLPEFAEEQQVNVTVGPGGPTAVTAKAFRFSASDGHWSLVLAPESLAVEAAAGGEYSSYSEFKEIFELAWNATVEHLAPHRVVHQGLRYIDHIEGERAGPEWADLINPELLGAAGGDHLSQGLMHGVSELRFQRPEGVLVFRHGITTAGPDNVLGYVLDFDYFSQEELSEFTSVALLDRFDAFHDLLYSFFRWCVTEQALGGFRGDA